MTARYARRDLLRAGGAVGLTGLTGLAGYTISDAPDDPPVDVRGALYLPSRAYNTYQMWHGYDRSVIERDLEYATRLNLNAIRTWLSYEHWQESPEEHAAAVSHFLSAADQRGIEVLFGLFEGVGVDATPKRLANRDPRTARAIRSPSLTIARNPEQWDEPKGFVRWFMDRYRSDDRLLAIEVMNEPGWRPAQKAFARGMFEAMQREAGAIPLTVGSTSLANDADYADWGSQLHQFHYNFPNNAGIYRRLLDEAEDVSKTTGKPAWLTEWQRTRSGSGFAAPISGAEWQPDYETLAPAIRKAGTGNFFWSLMVKPAYVLVQRRKGVLSGVFHEDGAVWDLGDARALKAMSGDRTFEGRERKEWPEWAAAANTRNDGQ
jgi:hypothetical protein